MKKIITILFLLFSALAVYSQSNMPVDATTNKITWQETIPLDSVSRDDMYERCRKWLAHYYKSGVYDVENKTTYTVSKTADFSIKLTYDFKYKSDNSITYSITLNQKEGKYRVTITDFKFYNLKSGAKTQISLEAAYAKMTTQNKTETNTQVTKEINVVLADLKTFMEKGYVKTQDDW